MTPVEFAERKVEELMKHHLEDMTILTRQAETTFAFAIAVASAVFGYFLKVYDQTQRIWDQNWSTLFPIAMLTLQLAGAAAYLLLGAMRAAPVQPPGNNPSTLIGEAAPTYTIDELRKAEMWGLAERAESNRQRNFATARVINQSRLVVLASPVTYLAAAALVA